MEQERRRRVLIANDDTDRTRARTGGGDRLPRTGVVVLSESQTADAGWLGDSTARLAVAS